MSWIHSLPTAPELLSLNVKCPSLIIDANVHSKFGPGQVQGACLRCSQQRVYSVEFKKKGMYRESPSLCFQSHRNVFHISKVDCFTVCSTLLSAERLAEKVLSLPLPTCR